MKILVCEDSLLTQKTIELTLTKAGHKVLSASDGEEGIQLLDKESFDLVVTDINMPHNSGLEIVQHIRTKLKLSTPIIVVSSIHLEDTQKHAYDLGALSYLTKPFDPKELLETIDSLTDNSG